MRCTQLHSSQKAVCGLRSITVWALILQTGPVVPERWVFLLQCAASASLAIALVRGMTPTVWGSPILEPWVTQGVRERFGTVVKVKQKVHNKAVLRLLTLRVQISRQCV